MIFLICYPISSLPTTYHSVLNMKVLVDTFNQENILVGDFSVIVKY